MKKQTRVIQSFWLDQAKKFGIKQDASWSDLLVQREIKIISQHLSKGDKVLDVGCANGYSSMQIATNKNINLLGIDYVSSMIKNANYSRKDLPALMKKRIKFQRGNVLKLGFADKTFDKVISIRCICNMSTWEDQQKALMGIWKVIKSEGTLLLSEPSKQGLANLNKLGDRFGLKQITAPWHNLYLDEEKLIEFIKPYFNLKIEHFSSMYYLFSRVLYRFFMNDDSSKLKRDSFFNKLGITLPSIGKFGVQRLYVLKKRSA